MRALILGGTAFFGKAIARQLAQAGWEVTLFTRGNLWPKDLPKHGHIKGDRNRLEDLHDAARKGPWDVVIDNIGYDKKQAILALEAFRTARRFLFTSTVSVYRFVRHRHPQPLKDDAVDFGFSPPNEDPGNVHWSYARGKLEAERTVIERSEAPWTILRPPVVYGPDDITGRGYWYLIRLLQGGPILLANGGANSFRLAYSEDVARAYVQALETLKTIGKCYTLAHQEIITLKDFVEESSRALGITPEYINVPFEFLGDLGGDYSKMTNFIPDFSAAVEDFGYTPTPFEQFVAATAVWFRDHWKGDAKALLKTRAEELKLAQQWKKATEGFPYRKPT